MFRQISAIAGGALGVAAGAWMISRRRRRITLQGRVVVVTGGGRGFGYAIAREFLRHGCKLAICGRDGEEIARAVAELRRRGADVFGMACDASDPVQVEAFIKGVLDTFGALDVLVNNAGQMFFGPVAELHPDDLEAAIRNILWVHYRPTMAVLPHMRARGFGRIVNITSVAGKIPIPHHAAYVVGKYAATGWSEVLTVELRKDGILVSTITPPPLANGAPLYTHFNGREEEEFKWFARGLTSRWSASSTDRAARIVVDAAIHGDRQRAISPGSWLAARAQGAAPGLMTRIWAGFDRVLPPPGPPGHTTKMRVGAEVVAGSADAEVQARAETARRDARRYRPPGS
ncbi:Short-chain dehydrogenase [Nannocystis exedens]|uniref:Short-chain dehydrogenase n=1 Tax=Nannocystis exedens TaxID=54 RepID=A0A1I1XGA0_9BACT|nr:SDR family oxidoreductase [Nannocystis exedens]PCC73433.1 ketoacyl reductase [Nannocystis exedens]SFE06322.1 Short-chain dehydrogenase [Nannocystis exedens]